MCVTYTVMVVCVCGHIALILQEDKFDTDTMVDAVSHVI